MTGTTTTERPAPTAATLTALAQHLADIGEGGPLPFGEVRRIALTAADGPTTSWRAHLGLYPGAPIHRGVLPADFHTSRMALTNYLTDLHREGPFSEALRVEYDGWEFVLRPEDPVVAVGPPAPEPAYVDVVFDAPPGAVSGRFVEVEDAEGRSVKAGEWIDRGDGNWALRLPVAPVHSGRPS